MSTRYAGAGRLPNNPRGRATLWQRVMTSTRSQTRKLSKHGVLRSSTGRRPTNGRACSSSRMRTHQVDRQRGPIRNETDCGPGRPLALLPRNRRSRPARGGGRCRSNRTASRAMPPCGGDQVVEHPGPGVRPRPSHEVVPPSVASTHSPSAMTTWYAYPCSVRKSFRWWANSSSRVLRETSVKKWAERPSPLGRRMRPSR